MPRLKSISNVLFVTCCIFMLQAITPQTAAGIDWLKSGQELLDSVTESSQDRGTDTVSNLTDSEITDGLKEALRVGTETVVGQLGTLDGFNSDPQIHIPLPASMKQVKSALATVGMAGMMDDLELKLNRAAEEATLPAKKLFWESIETMTLDDVMGIYNGPDDAATRYF